MIYLSDKKGGFCHHIGKPFVPCDIEEIAYRLSYINRFNGSVGSYSVAQHSVLVAHACPEHLQLAGLLHDVPEAYLGDVTAPLKRHIGGKYEELEEFYHDVIDKHYGVDTRDADVKAVDLRMLVTEAKCFGMEMKWFEGLGKPYNLHIGNMRPAVARAEFLKLYRELTE